MTFSRLRAVLLATALALPGLSVSAQDLIIASKSGPASMDPHFTATAANAEATKQIYDSLVRSGNDLSLQPGLATEWKALDDTTWEFKLREGVKFHDGSDFTAEDVKFSIERIPSVTGPNPTTIYVRRIAEVEIVDPYTVRLKTNGPAPTLPNDMIRLFIVSHNAAAGLNNADEASAAFNSGKAAIGTGPYKFVQWAPTEDLVLERFDDYWGGAEPWAKVIRKEISNDAARVAQLKAGAVDIISKVPATDIATLEADSNIALTPVENIYITYMEFDFREDSPQVWDKAGNKLAVNPLRDPRVREAFDLALDRETIVEFALEGLGAVPTQMVTESIFGYNPSLEPAAYDVAKAKALLAEAGYPDGFKVQLSYATDRLPVEMGPTVAQMLASIGIDVEVNGVPAAVFNPARTRGEYSLYMASWGTVTGEASYTLSSLMHTNDPEKGLGAFNVRGYSNPEMDKLIQEAGVEMDVEKRRELLEAAAALAATERPNLGLVVNKSVWAMKKDKVTLNPRVDEETLAVDIKPVK